MTSIINLNKIRKSHFPETLPLKTILPVVLSMLLFIGTFFGFILPRMEDNLMDRKRELIHALSESAMSSIAYYADLSIQGSLSVELAQQQAIAHLRSLRYGPEGKDYFWINDTHPRMIMHPYRPDMEGKDVTDSKDPAGKKLFQAFLATVKKSGGGYVNYHWQWQDDPTRIFSKISYVQEYRPWHWIIGTGVYVEDVHEQIAAITQHITLIFLGILAVIALLSVYIIWQGASVENKRRQMALSLFKSENRYRLLAETAREMILLFDAEFNISYANKACNTTLGFTRDYLIGTSILQLLPGELQLAFKEKIGWTGENRTDANMLETNFIAECGKIIPVEAIFAKMHDPLNPPTFLLTARDITDKKLAEAHNREQQEQLMQTNKMVALGTLVAGVAHEINNPISSVMLNIKVFERFWHAVKPTLDDVHSPDSDLEVGGMAYSQLRERMPQLLSYSQEGVTRVKRIVGDLKEFSSQRPGDLLETVNLNQVAQTSVGLLSGLIKKATINFEISYEESLPTLQGNSQRLGQVVINLIVNGCQATTDLNQPLRISTYYLEESEEVILEVSDSGKGMTPETMERIKDPFFTTKRDNSGTGLGLSISDTIVRSHGGWLHFRSEVGQGTTATLCLPRYGSDDIAGRMI